MTSMLLLLLTPTQVPCNNGTVQWNFLDHSYTSLNQFTIQLEYSYEDDS